MFLYFIVSTLKPTVGIVDSSEPVFILYKTVVFPAESSPSIKIRSSFLLKRETEAPIFYFWHFLHSISKSEGKAIKKDSVQAWLKEKQAVRKVVGKF